MNHKLRRGLAIVLAVVFLCSLSMFAYKSIQAWKGAKVYAEAETLAKLPDLSTESPGAGTSPVEPTEESNVWREAPVYDDPYMDALEQTDLEALREVNDDVLGWIVIPNTQLSYPLVQGEDNNYYLNRTWKQEPSSVGAIFLEKNNSKELSDFNTIVYGHRMLDGSMFASLKYYKKLDYWKEHPYIYVVDDAGSHRYEIFAAYEASVTGSTYRLDFSEDESRQPFLNDCMSWSVIDSGVIPTVNDRILTLSTCTGRGYESRWVVQARLEGLVEE